VALRRCLECTARFAVGLLRCPQCGGSDHEEDGRPKISKPGGVSYEPGREPDGWVPPAPDPDGAAADGAAPAEVPESPEAEPAPKPAPARAPRKAPDA
jgi:hypothetical protein